MTLPAILPEMPPPISPIGSAAQVTDAELQRYAALIYARTGIKVSGQKKALLSNRLRRRLRATGIENFDDYFEHLTRLPAADPEWDCFLQEITTHETYLFRDLPHWTWLRDEYLPMRAAAARDCGEPRTLRIWSAACSTGDEAATIACCIVAGLPQWEHWRVQIVGTDIGTSAVAQARAGQFGERAMRQVPEELKTRCFTKAKDAPLWQLKPALQALMSFRQHNLLNPLREAAFDVVCLKNVLIYFDEASKKRVMAHVRDAVLPGGMLLCGAAEGVSEMVRDFTRKQPWLYMRPKDPRTSR